jgi:hypothetical protein
MQGGGCESARQQQRKYGDNLDSVDRAIHLENLRHQFSLRSGAKSLVAPKCASNALYRKDNIGAFEFLTCGLQPMEESAAKRVQGAPREGRPLPQVAHRWDDRKRIPLVKEL